ncbi:uncharacterized protein LOC119734084 [Patiria miniata]|uniref:Uncharacterized protein n=1 Tax=Patiria miniata TaxID=46514 RepID=A0A914AIZ9_PATMI|nr:uncharacterized protein LOC119734084 [Patiria miniata]
MDNIPIAVQKRIVRQAATCGSNFKDIFLKFADVHQAINHAEYIQEDSIRRTEIAIKEFMYTYRQMFHDQNVTPKLHLLEDHATEQLRRFKVGFGFLNEQGGELIHTEFNRTGRAVHGMRDDLQRLMTIMKRNHISTAPEVRARVVKPMTKPKKKN